MSHVRNPNSLHSCIIKNDPAVTAYYDRENALAALEDAVSEEERIDISQEWKRADNALADAVPTSVPGVMRKIEAAERWTELLDAEDCEAGIVLSESHWDLLRRNNESLAKGVTALSR